MFTTLKTNSESFRFRRFCQRKIFHFPADTFRKNLGNAPCWQRITARMIIKFEWVSLALTDGKSVVANTSESSVMCETVPSEH